MDTIRNEEKYLRFKRKLWSKTKEKIIEECYLRMQKDSDIKGWMFFAILALLFSVFLLIFNGFGGC